jgi:hypothetical protein
MHGYCTLNRPSSPFKFSRVASPNPSPVVPINLEEKGPHRSLVLLKRMVCVRKRENEQLARMVLGGMSGG